MLLSLPSPDRPHGPEPPASEELPVDPDRAPLSPLDEEVNLEEEAATDLDIGFVIDEPLEAPGEAPEAGAELVLDIGELLNNEEGPMSDPADRDKAGALDEFVSDLGLEEEPALETSLVDEDEPLEEFLEQLEGIGIDLPDLQAEGGSELGAEADEDFPAGEAERPLDEPESSWKRQTEQDAPHAVLALADHTLVFAGDNLWWSVDERAPEQDAPAVGRVTSVALMDQDCVLLGTLSGEVYRKSRGRPAVRLDSWHAWVSRRESYVSVELCQAEKRDLVYLKLSTGILLESHDRGDSWKAVDLGGRVRGCSKAERFAAIVDGERGPRVVTALGGGTGLGELPLSGFAASVAEAELACVAANDQLVALGSFSTGVIVWAGAMFQRIPGCQSLTALTVGRLGGRSLAWGALYSDSEDISRIVVIDPHRAQARVIFKVQGFDPDAEFEDQARVHALLWDGSRSRLWVASTTRVSAWSPDASTAKGEP